MSTIEMMEAAEELRELERDFQAAKPFIRKHMLPWLSGAKSLVDDAILIRTSTHEQRDINTGYSLAYESFRKALTVLYETRKKELEDTIKREQARLDKADRDADAADGQPDPDSDPDPFTG